MIEISTFGRENITCDIGYEIEFGENDEITVEDLIALIEVLIKQTKQVPGHYLKYIQIGANRKEN